MTLLDTLNAFIHSLTTITPASRQRYLLHAKEAVLFYGENPRWGRARKDLVLGCIPSDYQSTRSIVNRTFAWMGS